MSKENTPGNPENVIINLLEEYIVNSIIPKMNIRRGRVDNLTTEKVLERLSGLPTSDKPGEFEELFEEFMRQVDGIDGQFASEIADNIYYSLQPNCPEEKREDVLRRIRYHGIPYIAALEFCIIKYETRMSLGEGKNTEVENEVLDEFIDKNYPHLKTLWTGPLERD